MEFVPADVGPDGKVVVPAAPAAGHGKGNGIVKTETFKETEEERRKREAEEEKEELERKVSVSVWCGFGCTSCCLSRVGLVEAFTGERGEGFTACFFLALSIQHF